MSIEIQKDEKGFYRVPTSVPMCALILDKEFPGWEWSILVKDIAMHTLQNCILGQVAQRTEHFDHRGRFAAAVLDFLFGKEPRNSLGEHVKPFRPNMSGFAPGDTAKETFAVYDAWVVEINKRRNKE